MARDYFTAMEASPRAPFIIRWPGKVPAGRVSNKIVHIVDILHDASRASPVRKSRRTGRLTASTNRISCSAKRTNTNREGFPAYVADQLSAVKVAQLENAPHLAGHDVRPSRETRLAEDHNFLTDLKEERDVAAYNTWVAEPMFKILANFQASLIKHPPIKAGTPDPYTPPN